MNYKIYQVYYKEEQKKFLDSEFTPFNNSINKRPDLLEYYIFNIGYKMALKEKLTHWGFFSWKWKNKCKMDPPKFIDFIEKNPNQDVYFINWAPYLESITLNVWIVGEMCHPGIINICNKIFEELGYQSFFIQDLIMDYKTYCFSSYFVASKKFWCDYLVFLKKIKYTIDNNSNLKELIYQKITYDNHTNYSFFPFLVERLFSTFLILNNKKYSISNYPSDFKTYQQYVGDNYIKIENCSKLKSKILDNVEQKFTDKLLNEWKEEKEKLINSMGILDIS